MTTPLSHTIGSVTFIYDLQKSKLLLLKRNRQPMKGLYTGVGGKTNFTEDIRASALREMKEETGLNVHELKLKGVVKTVLDGEHSSWILFVYVGMADSLEFSECEEGDLEWVDIADVLSYNLIGFIRELLPSVLKEDHFFEGTFVHDRHGNVIDKVIHS